MAFRIADRVKETSTSTSTTPFALSGAITGYIAFSAIPSIAVGDTMYYCIQAVDAAGTPTAEWECGLGTYSAANTLTRTTVLASSTGSAVNFSAGTKHVYLTMPAAQVAWARERLTAARTYYVRTDGNDSNTGLANTSGGAFLTIQKAVDVVSLSLDMGANQITIQVADGTYTGTVALKPYVGSLAPIIQGNVTTPANVLVSTTAASAFVLAYACIWALRDMKLMTTTSGYCINVSKSGTVNFQNIDFGASAGHISVASWGVAQATGAYAISGGASFHWVATDGGIISANNQTITLSNTPAFATAFCYLRTLGVVSANGTVFTNGATATGVRYNISMNSVVFVNGAATTYFPGDSAGTASSGGQYV